MLSRCCVITRPTLSACRRLLSASSSSGSSAVTRVSTKTDVDASFGDINATVGIGDTRSPQERRLSLRDRERSILDPSFSPTPATLSTTSPVSDLIYSQTTTGQIIYPAEPEDVEILSQSKLKFADPRLTEGSVVIRIVRLSDAVTSPVARVQRNRFFGIRGYEKYTFLAWGLCATLGVASLGVWQLRRMDFKAKLIERRRQRLHVPKIVVKKSPLPWNENNMVDYEYRTVEVSGVFDHSKEMLVGPRSSGVSTSANTKGSYGETSQVGYQVITPLLMEDGNTVLVNRGLLSAEYLRGRRQTEDPEWVTVCGVLVAGELSGISNDIFRAKNSPADKTFIYMVPADLATCAAPRNFEECKLAIVSVLDCRYHDNPNRARPRFMLKHKSDYMCFYADEHMHFNYAMQWFAMATVFFGMTTYKFVQMCRWRW